MAAPRTNPTTTAPNSGSRGEPTTTRAPGDQATWTSFSNSVTGWTLSSARESGGQLDRFLRAIGSGGADLSLQESAVSEQPVAVTDLGHA